MTIPPDVAVASLAGRPLVGDRILVAELGDTAQRPRRLRLVGRHEVGARTKPRHFHERGGSWPAPKPMVTPSRRCL